MKLSITSQVTTVNGLTITGAVGYINANTESLLADGGVSCTFQFYANDNAKAKNLSPIVLAILKQDGTIDKIISSCKVILTQQEVVAANLPNTIYTKVAAKLIADYGWTVVVA